MSLVVVVAVVVGYKHDRKNAIGNVLRFFPNERDAPETDPL